MASRRLNAVRLGLLSCAAGGTLMACAEKGTPLHRDYVVCPDNATDCGDNVHIVVNEQASAEAPANNG